MRSECPVWLAALQRLDVLLDGSYGPSVSFKWRLVYSAVTWGGFWERSCQWSRAQIGSLYVGRQ